MKSLQTDGKTDGRTDDRCSERLTWAFSSGVLKIAWESLWGNSHSIVLVIRMLIDNWAHLFRSPSQAGWYFRKRVTIFKPTGDRNVTRIARKKLSGIWTTIWRRTAVHVFLLVKYPFLLTEICVDCQIVKRKWFAIP